MSRMHLLLTAAVFALLWIPACFLVSEGSLAPGADGGDASTGGNGGTIDSTGGSHQGGDGGMPVGGGGSAGDPGCDLGFSCVPEITAGSFVRMRDESEDCDGEWQKPTAFAEPVKVGCMGCSCDPAPVGTCSVALRAYEVFDCSDLANVANVAGCINLSQTYSAFRLLPSMPSAETCAAVGGGADPLLNPATVCSLAAAPTQSCGDGMICVPEGSGALCNMLPEGDSCAAGYGTPADLAPITDDTRDCSCNCGLSTGQTCSQATAETHDSENCSGAVGGTIVDDGACTDVNNTSGTIFITAGTWSGGSCAPIPPTGEVTFGTTQTICCLQ